MRTSIEQHQMDNTYVMLPISLTFLVEMHATYRLVNGREWFDRQDPDLQGSIIFGIANLALLPTTSLLLPPYVKAFRKLYPNLLQGEFQGDFYSSLKQAFKGNLLPTLELGALVQVAMYFFKRWMMSPLEKLGLDLAASTTVIFLTLAPTYLLLRTLTATAIEAAQRPKQGHFLIPQGDEQNAAPQDIKNIFKQNTGVNLSLFAQTLALIACNYVAMEFMPTDKNDANLDLLYKLLAGLVVFLATLRSPIQEIMEGKIQSWGLGAPAEPEESTSPTASA